MNTTARRNNALVSARPANDRVTLENAHRLHATDGTTYPVSGDATMVGYGTIDFRRNNVKLNIWDMPGVSQPSPEVDMTFDELDERITEIVKDASDRGEFGDEEYSEYELLVAEKKRRLELPFGYNFG